MQILFCVLGYKPAWRIGGPIVSVSALAEGLVRRGHKVVVFTTNSNLDEDLDVATDVPVDVEGVEVWYFKRHSPAKTYLKQWNYLSRPMGFLYAPRMRAELDRRVPEMDLVHTHLPFNYPALAGAHAAFRHDKPLFYHQRGVLDPERLKFRRVKKALYLKLLEMRILRRATTLIALTEREVENYRRLGLRNPCRLIPNGVNVDELRNEGGAKELLDLNLRPEHQVILFMGRLHPTKGPDKLLEAFLNIHESFPHAVLVMAGPDEAGIEAAFRLKVARAGLVGRVIFPGMVGGGRKAALLARANLFCLPSDAEGFSIAVLEALGSATAVILSPGCNFNEVEQAGAGVVVNSDPASIAAALSQFLRDPDALRRMGERGRHLVASKYTWQQVVDTHIDAYLEGIERHRHTRSH